MERKSGRLEMQTDQGLFGLSGLHQAVVKPGSGSGSGSHPVLYISLHGSHIMTLFALELQRQLSCSCSRLLRHPKPGWG